ncbi:MAG: 2-oxoglutarate dehydrogenase complex dihydrolipoyllysine-residue succinyltransferase [Gemmatimonadaceae bacterium]|nr:2-oxoglutarate dehydrogenase complex dihydrolipoyllysine-residue succinyltransferase [Gemmatimonadaceae bacterium]
MISLKVPPLGESIVEATVSRWTKQEGESVAAGDTVVELETDKITVEVPALKAGVVTKHAKKEGDVVKVDEVLGEIDDSKTEGTAAPATAQPATAEPPKADAAPAARAKTDAAPASAEVKSSPAARKVAAESGVDISAVQGTGRGGVVSKPDVIDAARGSATKPDAAGAAGSAQPASSATKEPAPQAPPGAKLGGDADPARAGRGAQPGSIPRETREKMSTRRKKIAEHLLESQHSTAHLTTFNEIDMSAVMSLRDRLKERTEKEHGVKLSFMPFFVKAACLALKGFPNINAQVDGDSVVYKHYVHMGIAVASDQGLVVPNVKDADSKGMIQIARDITDVAKRARDGKLTMDDLTGGTFTITNGGVFGSLVSTPIINFPQVGILGLHKIQDRPVVIDGKIEARPMMYVALSYDHRIVDGQHSVLFLVRVKELMEDPATMLVD